MPQIAIDLGYEAWFTGTVFRSLSALAFQVATRAPQAKENATKARLRYFAKRFRSSINSQAQCHPHELMRNIPFVHIQSASFRISWRSLEYGDSDHLRRSEPADKKSHIGCAVRQQLA